MMKKIDSNRFREGNEFPIMQIAGKILTSGSLDPLIIAEIGVNFYDIAASRGISLMDSAKLMLREAIEAGADMAKFQTYKADKIAAKDSPAYWDTTKETTQSQHELFLKFDHFGQDEYEELAAYSESLGAPFLSTPFDLEAVDFLDRLMPAFKIASADITNTPLLQKVASKGKPILLSVGASTLDEVRSAVRFVKDGSEDIQICLLHCILNYPTVKENANLGMIQGLRDEFPDLPIGYSDHTEPSADLLELVVSVLLGACVIEKHFTLDKTLPGNDHYHAMDPDDLRVFLKQMENVRNLYGSREKTLLESEVPSLRFARRSIVTSKPVAAGESFSEENLIMKRPGTGIPPTKLGRIIGTQSKSNLPEDTILQWDDIDSSGD